MIHKIKGFSSIFVTTLTANVENAFYFTKCLYKIFQDEIQFMGNIFYIFALCKHK